MTAITPEQRASIRAALEKSPGQLTVQLARSLGVPEAEVVRLLPDGRSVELDARRWEALLRRFEEFGELHVIVTNACATLEAVGRFGGFSTFGEFFNVQTKSLDMHIRGQQLAAIFAVEKPSHMDDRPTLSFQFFDHAGASALKVYLAFGGGQATPERVEQFRRLRDEFRAAASPQGV